MLGGLTLNDYVCLTHALSWLYPANTGQFSSFPEAPRNLEASEANGTVSQYSVCLTRPWLTGARLSSHGPASLLSSTQVVLSSNMRTHKKHKPNMHLYSTGNWASYPHWKVGRGEFCIYAKSEQVNRLLLGDRVIRAASFLTHGTIFILENARNVEFPLFFFFPFHCVSSHHIKSYCHLLLNCFSIQQKIFVFLSETFWSLNIKSAPCLHTFVLLLTT